MKEVNDRVFAKLVPKFLPIYVGLAFLGATVRGDDENLSVRLAVLH